MDNENAKKTNKINAILFSAMGFVITIIGMVYMIIYKKGSGTVGLIPIIILVIGLAVLLTGIILLITWLKSKSNRKNKN